jgi:hypothetical protein
VTGPLLVGLIATWMGLRGSAIVLMFAGLLASAILFFLVKETRQSVVVHSTGEPEATGD